MKKSAVKKKDAKALTETLYQMIKSPLITEKTAMASEHGKVAFVVPVDADKTIIKDAVESAFKVKVTGVNTSTRKGKLKVFKGRAALRSDTKKAIVTLADGQTIDVTTGV